MEGQRIRSLSMRGVFVPLNFTLGTSAAIVRAVPLLLVDLTNEEGVTGRAYTFCYRPSGARSISAHLSEAVDLLKGEAITPEEASRRLSRQFALLGVTGTVRMALSLLDMALWDTIAQMHGTPLVTLLGGHPKALAAYDSRGLGLMGRDRLRAETGALLELGFKAVKVRLGYPSAAEDVGAIEAVRSVAGDDVAIMVDYNQALSVFEASLRGRELDRLGVYWLEEPIVHDDYKSYGVLASELRVPIQIGENFNGPAEMSRALDCGACDFVMPDVARIGGVSGWMQAAGIAAAKGVEMSSHLMPEISAHLLGATPTAHWLEYVDWANAILESPLRISDGRVDIATSAGSGVVWDEAKLKRLDSL
jgi:mandelate racemase